MALRRKKVADSRPDDWIEVDDENSVPAQAPPAATKSARGSDSLQKLTSRWERQPYHLPFALSQRADVNPPGDSQSVMLCSKPISSS